jgi:HAE1 family hydrophobic/amphiphilic exporter-1
VESPLGSSIQQTREAAFAVTEVIQALPGVSQVLITIGGGDTDSVNQASLTVDMVDPSERTFAQVELMDRVRRSLEGRFPNLKINVSELQQVGGSAFSNFLVNYSLRGTDLDLLVDYAKRIKNRLAETPGFVDLDISFDSGKPQVAVHIDRDRAADLGVSVAAIAQTINVLVGGDDVTTFQSGGDQFDVRVRLSPEDRDQPADIGRLLVLNRRGQPIELSNLIDVEEGTGAVEINRRNRLREVQVQANLTPDLPLGTAMQIIDGVVEEMDLPPGVIGENIGMAEIMQESFESMGFSLMLAIVIIYMALASLFENMVHPFTIMISLPLSISGAIGLLLLMGKTLNIMSFIGFIMLMGLVTKNAILLIDRAIQNRAGGMERSEALVEAGFRRIRPILMTAISTIAGAMPVALGLGAGAGFRSSMGVVIVGGMITSTLLTLIAVPMIYTFFDDLGSIRIPAWARFWRKSEKKEARTKEATVS